MVKIKEKITEEVNAILEIIFETIEEITSISIYEHNNWITSINYFTENEDLDRAILNSLENKYDIDLNSFNGQDAIQLIAFYIYMNSTDSNYESENLQEDYSIPGDFSWGDIY